MDAPRQILIAPKAMNVRQGKAVVVPGSWVVRVDVLVCTPINGSMATRQRADPT